MYTFGCFSFCTVDYKHCSNGWNVTTSDVVLLMETRFWIQRVLTPIVVIVGLIGNLVTIAVLTQHRMKCSTNIYLTALAVSDFFYLICFFMMSLKHYSGMDSERYYLYWILLPWLHWPTDASSKFILFFIISYCVYMFYYIEDTKIFKRKIRHEKKAILLTRL